MESFDLLVLGLGWQGAYSYEFCKEMGMKVAATTRDGREGSIKWSFDPCISDPNQYLSLPSAATILITFPLPEIESSALFLKLYTLARGVTPNLILYGSTRAFVGTPWADRNGPVKKDARYLSEEFFLQHTGGCVLNLSGLYGGLRRPNSWIQKVIISKQDLAKKSSIHLIHGLDVARLTYAVIKDFPKGQRYIVTDTRVYDWWELVLGLEPVESDADFDARKLWLRELMNETSVRSLPRETSKMERALDSTATWVRFKYPFILR